MGRSSCRFRTLDVADVELDEHHARSAPTVTFSFNYNLNLDAHQHRAAEVDVMESFMVSGTIMVANCTPATRLSPTVFSIGHLRER